MLKIYINYLDTGGIHSGCYYGRNVIYVRDAIPEVSHGLNGFIEISLNPDTEKNWAEICRVIDEAMNQISTLGEGCTHHQIRTTHGSFEYLHRAGIPSDAESIKKAVSEELSRIEKSGSCKIVAR